MIRETVIVVDQLLGSGGVDFDSVGVCLPVRREDDDGFGLDLLGDLAADGLQFGVCWVVVVFEEVGSS